MNTLSQPLLLAYDEHAGRSATEVLGELGIDLDFRILLSLARIHYVPERATYCVSVHSSMFDFDHIELSIFHELGHHVIGDVNNSKHHSNTPRPQIQKTHESACDAFAYAMLAAFYGVRMARASMYEGLFSGEHLIHFVPWNLLTLLQVHASHERAYEFVRAKIARVSTLDHRHLDELTANSRLLAELQK